MNQALQVAPTVVLPAPHESIDENLFVARNENNIVYTTSLALADAFGANHNNMLQSIRRVRTGVLFKNFDDSFWDMTYKSRQNKDMPYICLNHDGITLFFLTYNGDTLKKCHFLSLFKTLENMIEQSYNRTVPLLQPTQLTPPSTDWIRNLEDDAKIAYGLEAAVRKIQFLEQVAQEQQDQIQFLGEELDSKQTAVDFMDAVCDTVTTISVRELAVFINQCLKKAGAKKTQFTGQNRLFKRFVNDSLIFKPRGGSYYVLTQKGVESGNLCVVETPCVDEKGITHLSRVIRVTGKGQQFFCDKFVTEFKNKNGGIHNGIQGPEVRADVHDCGGPDERMGQDSADEGT